MLDPIINFFSRMFFLIGRGIGLVIAWILWPFLKVAAWYRSTAFLWQAIVGLILLAFVAGYGWFIYNAVTMPGYDPDYVTQFDLKDRKLSAGERLQARPAAPPRLAVARRLSMWRRISRISTSTRTAGCRRCCSTKPGLFGLSWDRTPFLDNKAAFQRGIHVAVQRVSTSWWIRLAACGALRRLTRICRRRVASCNMTQVRGISALRLSASNSPRPRPTVSAWTR